MVESSDNDRQEAQSISSPLPAAGTLTTAFRRFATRTTLIVGLLGAAGPTQAAPGANIPGIGQKDEKSQVVSSQEKKRRARIRETLLKDARSRIDALEAGAATGYSRQLEELQDNLTKRLGTEHSTVHDKVAVVDPAKVDVALSLGFSPDYAVETILGRQEVQLPHERLELAAKKAVTYYESKFGIKTYTQDPTAVTNLNDAKAEACVLIPSSERALEVDIAGLSRQEQVDFTNRHESWHCLDGKYTLRDLDPKKVEAVKVGTLLSQMNNPTALEIYATLYRKEALADAGALGDMIRGGKEPGLIDKVATWRAGDPEDLQHLSSPVLKGLKAKIAEIGVENFRKLDDASAEKLYFEVTDTYGMTGKSLETALRFSQAKPAERPRFLQRAKTDPDAARAMVLMTYLVKPPPHAASAAVRGLDRQAAASLKNWDADRLLDDKAFELSRKITPGTIIQAYNTLQQDLEGKMASEPDNKLYPLQSVKLQQAFLTHARELDYVEANAKRGVDIVKNEPSLRAFVKSPKKNAVVKISSGD